MAEDAEQGDSPSGSPVSPDPQHEHGHFFTKKTFHRPTYCHHCTDILWGLIGVGYVCEGKGCLFYVIRSTFVHVLVVFSPPLLRFGCKVVLITPTIVAFRSRVTLFLIVLFNGLLV